MSRGEFLSLEEARKAKCIDNFCKEHQSEGNEAVFNLLLSRMIKSSEEDDQTSDADTSAC